MNNNEQPSPFKKYSDGTPYLEGHHWMPLVDRGLDIIDNAGALWPNCYKHAHFGKKKEYIMHSRKLYK